MPNITPILIVIAAIAGLVWLHSHLSQIKDALNKIVGHTAAATANSFPPVIVQQPAPAPAPYSPPVSAPKPAQAALPAGVTWADENNGLVYLSDLEKFYPGRRYAVKQAEDYVPPGGSAFYALVQNIQNCSFADAEGMIQYGVFSPSKPNALTNGYSLDTSVKLTNVFVCPEKYPTFDLVVSWLTGVAQANAANPANANAGAGFSPSAPPAKP